MANEPKNHHIIPQKGYLEKFTNRNKKIFRCKLNIPKLPKKLKDFSTAAICYIPNYYRFENLDLIKHYNIEDPLILEKRVFQFYEKYLGRIINKIVKKQSFLTIENCKQLLHALFEVKFRNPSIRNSDIQSLIEQTVKDLLNDKSYFERISQYYNLNLETAIEKTIAIKKEFQKNSPNDLHNSVILARHLNGENIHQFLYYKLINLEWQILCSPVNNQFITSDNPGFCIESNTIYNSKFSGNFTFIYPISPQYALQISMNKSDILHDNSIKNLVYRHVGNPVVHEINQMTAQIANNEIYGANENILRSEWNSFINKKKLLQF